MTGLTASRGAKGGIVAGLAIGFGSVVLLASALPVERAAAQTGFFSSLTRAEPVRYRRQTQPPDRAPAQSRKIAAPVDPEDMPIAAPKSNVLRPPGSSARVCANQEKDAAAYRIEACTAIIATGKLKGEALGVAYALRGLAHLDRADLPHAIGDLNKAIELAPDFSPAFQNRGNAWYARGNFGQALADYDKTIALDPQAASPYVNRAALRRDLGYNDGAIEDYRKAIELRPNHAAAYSGRGQLYLRQKDYPKAVSDLDIAIRLDPDFANYMLRAQIREASGDLDKALRDYQQASQLSPKDATPLNAEAAVWRRKGDMNKSIAALDRAIPLQKNPAISYRMRAEAWRDKGDRKRAYADVGRALKFAWSINGLSVRGNMRLQDGDSTGALRDAESMLKIEDDNTDAVTLRALAYVAKKDYARALPDLDKAIAADSDNAMALSTRGNIYVAQNEPGRALTDYSRAINLKVSDPAIYRARAAIYKSKGETAKAIGDLDQAIGIDPKPAEPYFDRAGLRRVNGDANGAIADLTEALNRKPDNVAALKLRADIELADKNYVKAIDDLSHIVALEPGNAQTLYLRGQAYEQTRRRDLAKADYTAALSHDSKMEDARQALASLTAEDNRQKEAAIAAAREAKAGKTGRKVVPRALATRPAPEPEVTASIPPAAEPAGSKNRDLNGEVKRQVKRELNRDVKRDTRREVHHEVHRETPRQRAKREFEERENARHERIKRDREWARRTVRAPQRELTPSEKRRLYFEALDRRNRSRAARFTDVFPDRR